MVRIVIGAAAAALAMFFIGFIFFGPLGLLNLAVVNLDDSQAAAVQQTLAANLPRTGTYFVPYAEGSAAQTVMYGQGPIATIHYNIGGFAAMDPASLFAGLVLNFVVALLLGVALLGLADQLPDLKSRAKPVAIAGVAATAFIHLGQPIYVHLGWAYFIYAFVADSLMVIAAAFIIAWFLPSRAAPKDAPTEV